jgi:hypothetical protein
MRQDGINVWVSDLKHSEQWYTNLINEMINNKNKALLHSRSDDIIISWLAKKVLKNKYKYTGQDINIHND